MFCVPRVGWADETVAGCGTTAPALGSFNDGWIVGARSCPGLGEIEIRPSPEILSPGARSISDCRYDLSARPGYGRLWRRRLGKIWSLMGVTSCGCVLRIIVVMANHWSHTKQTKRVFGSARVCKCLLALRSRARHGKDFVPVAVTFPATTSARMPRHAPWTGGESHYPKVVERASRTKEAYCLTRNRSTPRVIWYPSWRLHALSDFVDHTWLYGGI